MADALTDLLVLDCSESVAASWCTRMLADFGAQTVLIEPKDGVALRRLEPSDNAGVSIVARNVLANKQSIAVERPPSNAQATLLTSLLERADVVVANDATRLDELFSLDAAGIRESYPGIVIAFVSQAGMAEDRDPSMLDSIRDPVVGHDLFAYAMSGWASVNGLRDRPPLKGARYTASMIAGSCAYGAIVTALLARQSDGMGRTLDVAENEAMLFMFGRAILRAQYEDDDPQRPQTMSLVGGFPVKAADGYASVGIGVGGHSRDALIFLGLESLAQSKWSQEHTSAVLNAIRGKTRLELIEGLGPLRVGVGPAFTVAELLRDQHLDERAFFRPAEDDPTGPRYCGPAFRMSQTPARLRCGIPGVGEHAEAVQALSVAQRTTSRKTPSKTKAPPLAGANILTFTHAWSGTFCTQLLGLAGADVLQIEAPGRPDGWRMSRRPMPKVLEKVASAKNPWNCSGFYNSANLNKRAIALDVKDPRGRELFLQLFEQADVVVENFSPHVMRNWQLDYESLQSIKPDLVMCSLSAFGATGPYGDFIGFGGTIEPVSGMSSLLGYGDRLLNSGNMIPDPIAGYYAFAAIVTALLHRERTGAGQHIDLSMQEACMTIVGDAFSEQEILGVAPTQLANFDHTFAPHGYYPTAVAAPGTDEWIALWANEQAWPALCKVMASAELTKDSRFATNRDRLHHTRELDTLIANWSSQRSRSQLLEELTAAGVPSVPVLSALEASRNNVFFERGAIARVEHPEAGGALQPVSPFRIDGQPCTVSRPSPMFGEHSREVLTGELGLSDEQYETLVREHVTGNVPLL